MLPEVVNIQRICILFTGKFCLFLKGYIVISAMGNNQDKSKLKETLTHRCIKLMVLTPIFYRPFETQWHFATMISIIIYMCSVVELKGEKFSYSVLLALSSCGLSSQVVHLHVELANLLVVLERCLKKSVIVENQCPSFIVYASNIIIVL